MCLYNRTTTQISVPFFLCHLNAWGVNWNIHHMPLLVNITCALMAEGSLLLASGYLEHGLKFLKLNGLTVWLYFTRNNSNTRTFNKCFRTIKCTLKSRGMHRVRLFLWPLAKQISVYVAGSCTYRWCNAFWLAVCWKVCGCHMYSDGQRNMIIFLQKNCWSTEPWSGHREEKKTFRGRVLLQWVIGI